MTDPVHKDFLPAVFGLVRGIRKRFNARAAAMEMTYARAQALLHISACEGLSQAELAERLEIRTPSMNRTLDHLNWRTVSLLYSDALHAPLQGRESHQSSIFPLLLALLSSQSLSRDFHRQSSQKTCNTLCLQT